MMVISIDPHESIHTATVLDPGTTCQVDSLRFESALSDYRRMLAWAGRWPHRGWAVENPEGLGRHLTSWLPARGEHVVDVRTASCYANLTMEAIAVRAGTSRAVLYRRWPERAALVIATLRRHRPMLSGETPDTGNLRADIVALLRRASTRLTELGPETIYGLLGDYFAKTTSFQDVQDQAQQIGTDITTAILKRAAGRGEVSPSIDPRIAALPTDLFRNELLTTRTPPSEEVIDDIVDKIFLPLVQSPQTKPHPTTSPKLRPGSTPARTTH